MYESRKKRLIKIHEFYWRLATHVLIATCLIALSLGMGIWGYMHYEKLSMIDALLNASMLLGGMGPVNLPVTDGGKIFASLYALYSGLVFLLVVGVVISPVIHRVLHQFYVDDDLDADVSTTK